MIRVRGARMAFSVRPVVAADWQELREMRLRALATDPEAFSSTHEDGARIPEQEWRARAAASEHGQEGQWFAAVDEGGRWVGTASVRGQGQSGSAGLFAMWVAPEARRSGVAGALCDACCAWAAEHGYGNVILGVMADNARAIAAYSRAGFVEYDRFTEPRGERRLDLRMMRRALG